jgi:hypothetical protein
MAMRLGSLALGLALFTGPAWALVPGGGPRRTDCYAEWKVTTLALETKGPDAEISCVDGDARCDADGDVDGLCTFTVAVCAMQTTSGCRPRPVKSISFLGRTADLGLQLPSLPATTPVCGPDTPLVLPLQITAAGDLQPSERLTLRMRAKAKGVPRSDRDTLTLRCTPSAKPLVRCPARASGSQQPNELRLTVAPAGTDLDIGRSGPLHNFPTSGGTRMQLCLVGCDATNEPRCATTLPVGTDTLNGSTFGPPQPLLAAGIPLCVQNRFTASQPVGSANLQSGEIEQTILLESDVFLTDETNVCPRCERGICNSGPAAGRRCRVDGEVTVAEAVTSSKVFKLSKDCPPPSDLKAGTLAVEVPLTTGTSILSPLPGGSAATPCVRQPSEPVGLLPLPDICPAGGTCTATCTGAACATQGFDFVTAQPACVDAKGGLSQLCCSSKTDNPCFPTGPGSLGALSRAGRPMPPQPLWPDPTYSKTTDCTPGNCAVMVATFCEPATGTGSVDGLAGLPGPAAVVLPVRTEWLPSLSGRASSPALRDSVR